MKYLFWAASAAFVATAISPATGQDKSEKPKEEKKICRKSPVETGTILGGKRKCHTAAEWAVLDAQNARNTERALEQRRSTSGISR
jgi:hypothetical protein